jgi:hypothetical protein
MSSPRQNPGQTPVECFEVTAREASAHDGAIRWPDFMIAPIFPHGAPVLVYGA